MFGTLPTAPRHATATLSRVRGLCPLSPVLVTRHRHLGPFRSAWVPSRQRGTACAGVFRARQSNPRKMGPQTAKESGDLGSVRAPPTVKGSPWFTGGSGNWGEGGSGRVVDTPNSSGIRASRLASSTAWLPGSCCFFVWPWRRCGGVVIWSSRTWPSVTNACCYTAPPSRPASRVQIAPFGSGSRDRGGLGRPACGSFDRTRSSAGIEPAFASSGNGRVVRAEAVDGPSTARWSA